jgi:endonuclease YncB( thermonuclease family)
MPAHRSTHTRAFQSLLMAIAIAFSASAKGTDVVSGEPRIVDGDTVEIGTTKIRFTGIDAPETDQLCLDAQSAKWACGIAARDALVKFSAGRPWDCDITGVDKYGRSLGNCFIEGDDVSAWMVRSGWALSFTRYSHQYDKDEGVARAAGAGLWAGSFIAPWDWRHRNVATEVLGATRVPIDAQKLLMSAVSAEQAPSLGCIIKATVGGKECIYHQPGDLWYGKMRMDGDNKRWFCSIGDAEAAGCRAPNFQRSR